MTRTSFIAAALSALLACTHAIASEAPAADPATTWDLTELYPSVDAWNQAREEVLAEFDKIEERRGTLGESADSLYQAYRHVSDTLKKASRVFVYASLQGDEDMRITETQERRQLSQIMFARFNEATAWMQPEIISIGREVIESYIKEDPRLEPFGFQLDDSLRNAPHTLGEEAEQTLSYFSQSFGAPSNTYSMLANSDIPWPAVTLSTGEEVTIDSQGYGKVRGSAVRDDRKLAFDTFWSKWKEYRSSVGLVLNSHIQTQTALAGWWRILQVLDVPVEIVDDAGHPTTGAGRIRITGPTLMAGYLNPRLEPGDGLVEGSYTSSDLGVLDRRGRLRVPCGTPVLKD